MEGTAFPAQIMDLIPLTPSGSVNSFRALSVGVIQITVFWGGGGRGAYIV